jgi:hypothetical protein
VGIERAHTSAIDAVVWALAGTTQQPETSTAPYIPSIPGCAAFAIPMSTWCLPLSMLRAPCAAAEFSHFCVAEFDAEGFCEYAGPTAFKDAGPTGSEEAGPTGFEHPATNRVTASANAEGAEKRCIVTS